MDKSPVHFVFGNHGAEKRPPNRSFFQKAVVPFLHEQVTEGRRVFIIREKILVTREKDFFHLIRREQIPLFISLYELERRGHDIKLGRKLLEMMQRSLELEEHCVNRLLRLTIDAGKNDPAAWESLRLDWGFDEAVLAINGKKKGQIRNVVEPQSFEACCLHLMAETIAGDTAMAALRDLRMNLYPHVVHAIKSTAKACIIRDKMLMSLLERLVKEDQGAAFVIPRGRLHKGMVNFVNGEMFQISIDEEDDSLSAFQEAVTREYAGDITEEELREYVREHLRTTREMLLSKMKKSD